MTKKIIGLTGGIGCGKTEVARIFQKLGAKIIDADLLGKMVVDGSPQVLTELAQAFGQNILDDEGRLKRKELGNLVFADKRKRETLNRIVHPHLVRQIQDRVLEAQNEAAPLVVVDAALIYELNLSGSFDQVVVVTAELANRIARIQARDGLSHQEVMDRIRSQMPLEEKTERADIVIANDGTLEDLERRSQAVFEELMRAK